MLGIIEGLLVLNMGLFTITYSLLSHPPWLVSPLMGRIGALSPGEHEAEAGEVAERAARLVLTVLGSVGGLGFFVSTTLTSFMIHLYRQGVFWRY